MKSYLLALGLLIAATAQAQNLPIDSTTRKVDYQEVIKVDSVSKDELYTRCREWFAVAFKDAKAVLEMDDKPSGKLIGKGLTKGTFQATGASYPFSTNFTVYVTCKDNRYRYEFTDFYIIAEFPNNNVRVDAEKIIKNNKGADGTYSGMFKDLVNGINNTANILTATLKEAMNKKGKSKDDF